MQQEQICMHFLIVLLSPLVLEVDPRASFTPLKCLRPQPSLHCFHYRQCFTELPNQLRTHSVVQEELDAAFLVPQPTSYLQLQAAFCYFKRVIPLSFSLIN